MIKDKVQSAASLTRSKNMDEWKVDEVSNMYIHIQ
jgi:hypothetical protein